MLFIDIFACYAIDYAIAATLMALRFAIKMLFFFIADVTLLFRHYFSCAACCRHLICRALCPFSRHVFSPLLSLMFSCRCFAMMRRCCPLLPRCRHAGYAAAMLMLIAAMLLITITASAADRLTLILRRH